VYVPVSAKDKEEAAGGDGLGGGREGDLGLPASIEARGPQQADELREAYLPEGGGRWVDGWMGGWVDGRRWQWEGDMEGCYGRVVAVGEWWEVATEGAWVDGVGACTHDTQGAQDGDIRCESTDIPMLVRLSKCHLPRGAQNRRVRACVRLCLLTETFKLTGGTSENDRVWG
jgi:hypothetical protein